MCDDVKKGVSCWLTWALVNKNDLEVWNEGTLTDTFEFWSHLWKNSCRNAWNVYMYILSRTVLDLHTAFRHQKVPNVYSSVLENTTARETLIGGNCCRMIQTCLCMATVPSGVISAQSKEYLWHTTIIKCIKIFYTEEVRNPQTQLLLVI